MKVLAMRVPAAKTEVKATTGKPSVQAETGMKGGMFAEERTESLVVKPSLFLSWPFGDKARIGNVRNREARDRRWRGCQEPVRDRKSVV